MLLHKQIKKWMHGEVCVIYKSCAYITLLVAHNVIREHGNILAHNAHTTERKQEKYNKTSINSIFLDNTYIYIYIYGKSSLHE